MKAKKSKTQFPQFQRMESQTQCQHIIAVKKLLLLLLLMPLPARTHEVRSCTHTHTYSCTHVISFLINILHLIMPLTSLHMWWCFVACRMWSCLGHVATFIKLLFLCCHKICYDIWRRMGNEEKKKSIQICFRVCVCRGTYLSANFVAIQMQPWGQFTSLKLLRTEIIRFRSNMNRFVWKLAAILRIIS